MDNACGKVIKILNKKGVINKTQLINLLKNENLSDEDINQSLAILEREFKIVLTKDGCYELLETKNKKVGQLHMNEKGYGFVKISDDCEVFIPANKLKGCIHNDTVLIRTSEKNGKMEGIIEKRLARNATNLVGEVAIIDGEEYIIPDNKKYKIKVRFYNPGNLVPGHKVTFKLEGEVKEDVFSGKIEEVIGHKNEPGVDILSVIKAYEVPVEFSKEALEELKTIPMQVDEKDIKDRLDLRDKLIFTIDGDDTKDIDDAISLDIKENGNYLLGGHIADVSHYVKPNTALDLDACARGTSNYLADRVIPMLPSELSNGICSLNPNVDRLALSFFVEIDKEGNIVDFDIAESVIRSKKQMTYKNVNKILEEETIPEGYELYVDKLKEMNNLAHLLRKNRVKRGNVDFDIDEIKLDIDESGKTIGVSPRERGEGEKLIEDFMIAINEGTAEYATNLDLPFLYRIHDLPREEKIEEIVNILAGLEYDASKMIRKNLVKYPKIMQSLLNDLKDREDYKVLASHILRSVKKAEYSDHNIGHFALASKAYSHLTSPIRRYPDLENHRILKELVIYNKYEEEVINNLISEVSELGPHLSNRERIAQDLEREVDKMKIAEYMEKHIGEEYDGVICDIFPKNMYVQLPNLIEGRLNLEKGKEKYIFNQEKYTLTNVNKNLVYKLGMPVKVKLIDASKEKHTIDFALVDSNDKPKIKKVEYGNSKQKS